MTLRYPSNFNVKMPFIHFKAYKYLCPAPQIYVLEDQELKSREDASDVEEVVLYMPGDFTENVNATWAMEDVFQGGQPGQDVSSLVVSNVSKLLTKSQDGNKVASSIYAAAGHMPFPTDINIFKAVEPMSFSLSFNMIPYDSKEGDDILKITSLFKKQILPRVSGAKNAFLAFPHVWDLSFENINGMGLTGSKYENMCLTNCSVAYVSGSEGASVYHDGNPTQVRLTLGFQALNKHFIG